MEKYLVIHEVNTFSHTLLWFRIGSSNYWTRDGDGCTEIHLKPSNTSDPWYCFKIQSFSIVFHIVLKSSVSFAKTLFISWLFIKAINHKRLQNARYSDFITGKGIARHNAKQSHCITCHWVWESSNIASVWNVSPKCL